MNFIFYKKTEMKTLRGTFVTVNVPRFLHSIILKNKIELWIAKKICPDGWAIIDESDLSYYEYLKECNK